MGERRRTFLKTLLGTAGGASAGALSLRVEAAPGEAPAPPVGALGCLVDTTLCIGCRACEEACNNRHELPSPPRPFADRAVTRTRRRPSATAFTVVNAFAGSPSTAMPEREETYVKSQCMHCLDPACVSACIVAALRKQPEGPVSYEAGRCIGCRYCMVACPFEIPAYEYHEALEPRVRKCTFCVDDETRKGAAPACAASCPTEALVVGPRAGLLALARERMAATPRRYRPRVYGDREVGGTSWLYLLGRPLEELDLPPLPDEAPPRLTEAIQHGIFRYGAAPLAVFGGLAALMWFNRRRQQDGAQRPPETEVEEIEVEEIEDV